MAPWNPLRIRLIAVLLLLSWVGFGNAAAWTDPKDALVNPRGRKVCLDQCGTVGLVCPEAFVCCFSFLILFLDLSSGRESAGIKRRGIGKRRMGIVAAGMSWAFSGDP